MTERNDDRRPGLPQMPRQFATTRWSVVLAAGEGGTPGSREALARLCEIYWYPLYAFARRWGHTADEAQDLTQEFFARLLEKHYLGDVRPERGRFRSFLLASLRHFLLNERDRVLAQKRGGGHAPISLEFDAAEGRYRLEPRDTSTPETLYERRWALTLLDQVLQQLEREHRDSKRDRLFEALKGLLTGQADTLPYVEIASRLGMTEGAVKVAAHRLRRRFGELLRQEIAETVADPADVEDEIRYLFKVLAA
ncbi:MAG: sigma-70 family RNA polymerase sigma factor [Acidobacteria bacterium]|nr:sigma-70 family RNA polymerase sigma factor [Acidobacteriota bacterium]